MKKQIEIDVLKNNLEVSLERNGQYFTVFKGDDNELKIKKIILMIKELQLIKS